MRNFSDELPAFIASLSDHQLDFIGMWMGDAVLPDDSTVSATYTEVRCEEVRRLYRNPIRSAR